MLVSYRQAGESRVTLCSDGYPSIYLVSLRRPMRLYSTEAKRQVRRRGSSQVRDISIESAIADFSADKKKNDNYGDVKDTLDDDPRNGWTTKGELNTEPHSAVFALGETLTLEEEEELVLELR